MANVVEYVAQMLSAHGKSVCSAESCTGGLLGANLTRLPGSSAFYSAGFVIYSNEAKQQLLNVSAGTLKQYGAVSEEVVREMALGALVACKADYALSISGIAGPDGGSEDKPVGTVWIGLAAKARIVAFKHHFSGSRDEVRAQAVQAALTHLAQRLHSEFAAPKN